MIGWDVVVALVAAILFDWKGVLPKALADRLAAVLAVYVFARVLGGTSLGPKLRSWGQHAADLLGSIAGRWTNAQTAQAISQYLVAAVVIFVIVLWIAAMLPAESTRKYGGDVVSREMSSWDIWGGALALTVGVAAIPNGTVGDFLRSMTDLIASFGHALAGAVS